MATVGLRRVSKVYATGARAVDHVDLEVADGELFVVVGPSGCGKSTLLRIIAGLEAPTDGQVLIDGADVTGDPPRRRDVAMTSQSGALYPHLDVAENLAFPLRATGVGHRETERRVGEVAALLRIDDLLDRRPATLSGGQRQRVAMGRSIIRRPQVLLLDEPLANLDTKLRVEMRSSIARLQRRFGLTAVFVTHDQVEAMAIGDRLAVMRSGRIVQTGRPIDVYRRPADAFVGTFLGSPPMGLALGRAVSGGPQGSGLAIGRQWVPWPGLTVGGPVAVGFRAEALRPAPDGPLTGSVVGMEDLGHEVVLRLGVAADRIRSDEQGLHVDTDVEMIVSVVIGAGRVPDRWHPVRLAVDTGLLHLFDLATGLALRTGPATGVVGRVVHH